MQQIIPGTRQHLLTIIGEVHPLNRRGRGREVLAACACGNHTRITLDNLKRTKSCGCLRSRTLAKTGLGAKSPEYQAWTHMKDRCLNPRNRRWDQYGGRGISVCARWMDFAKFARDMGRRPPGMSLDRINNDGNYEKANCRWATPKEQANNRSRKRNTVPRCQGRFGSPGRMVRCSLRQGHDGMHTSRAGSAWDRGRVFSLPRRKTN